MVMNESNMFSILKKLLSKDEINKLEETLIIEDENVVKSAQYLKNLI